MSKQNREKAKSIPPSTETQLPRCIWKMTEFSTISTGILLDWRGGNPLNWHHCRRRRRPIIKSFRNISVTLIAYFSLIASGSFYGLYQTMIE